MLWKLRLLWDRVDFGAVAFFIVAGMVIGGLVAAALGVFADRDERARRQREADAKNIECLARNVYFEARGEPLAGQYAVAEVTMNRRGWGFFRRSVCQVVYEPGAFSWTSQRGLSEPDGDAWNSARKVAENVYWQRYTPRLEGVRYYHASYVSPDWAKEKVRVARIGRHIFYR
jgi:N-acetylmuramoyl-L-alanine amidase